MNTFTGTVSGIDVIEMPGNIVRCFAFISRDASDEIQVITDVHALQTVLESASVRKAKVSVTFTASGVEKKLTRVQVLDR
jgi:hypothetical protein